MIVLGLLLIALGLVGGALIVDLLIAGPLSGRVDLDLIGIPLEAPAGSVLLATAVLAAVSTLLVGFGIAIVARRRARRTQPAPTRRPALSQADDEEFHATVQARLWQARIEVLEDGVRDLERRRDDLLAQRGLLEHGKVLSHVTAEDGSTEAILLVPELEEERSTD